MTTDMNQPIVNGKVKTVFDTDDAQRVLIRYEDKVTAWNGKILGCYNSMGSGYLFRLSSINR